MCQCVDVEMGSYDNTVVVDIPKHMNEYKRNRMNAGLSGELCIDRCILPEILCLWILGIHTRGCCCGHNKISGMINVADSSIQDMINLGYKEYPNPAHKRHGKPFTFYTKTLGTRHE